MMVRLGVFAFINVDISQLCKNNGISVSSGITASNDTQLFLDNPLKTP